MAFKDQGQFSADGEYVVDGEHVEDSISNRPHEQLSTNTDHLASAFNADRNLRMTGGGTMQYARAGTAGTWTWGSDIHLHTVNEEISGADIGGASEHDISAGNINIPANHQIVYLLVDRQLNHTAAGVGAYASGDMGTCQTWADLKALIEAHATQRDRFQYVVLACREQDAIGTDNDNITLLDGRRILHDQSIQNAGATDTQYTQQTETDDLTNRSNQDRNLHLVGGGIISWGGPGNGLAFDGDLVLYMPTDNLHTIPVASSPLANITNDEVYVVDLTRTDATNTNPTAVAVHNRNDAVNVVKEDDNLFILAYCGNDNRLYLADGTVLEPGYQGVLGGLAQGVRWIYTGPGTSVAAYDFTAQGQVHPALSTPEYIVGGTELMVWVNGSLRSEGTYRDPAGAAGADYDETGVAGSDSTTITFTAGNIPNPSDKVVAAVGVSNPFTAGLIPYLEAADSAGTQIGVDVLLNAGAQLRQDADETIILGAPAANQLDIEVGGFIADPVRLRCRHTGGGGTIIDGALKLFGHRPTVHYDDTPGSTTNIMVSPGEVCVPITAARETWYAARSYHATFHDTTVLASWLTGAYPGAYPAIVYVYAFCSAGVTYHDGSFDVGFCTTPPVQLPMSEQDWLSHPTVQDAVFIGSVLCTGPGGSGEPTSVIPFDRVGDDVIFRPGNIVANNLYDQVTAGAAGPGAAPLGSVGYVPITATGAIFHGEYTLDWAAWQIAGSLPEGITLAAGLTGPVGGSATVMNDDQDAWFLVQPLDSGAPPVVPTGLFTFGPCKIPTNNYAAGVAPPATSVGWTNSVFFINILLKGYTEPASHIYRHA